MLSFLKLDLHLPKTAQDREDDGEGSTNAEVENNTDSTEDELRNK